MLFWFYSNLYCLACGAPISWVPDGADVPFWSHANKQTSCVECINLWNHADEVQYSSNETFKATKLRNVPHFGPACCLLLIFPARSQLVLINILKRVEEFGDTCCHAACRLPLVKLDHFLVTALWWSSVRLCIDLSHRSFDFSWGRCTQWFATKATMNQKWTLAVSNSFSEKKTL